MLVKEELELFWKRHQLGDRGKVDASWNFFRAGFLRFYLPNLSKKGYLLHDVNHLLSGYGIDWRSEFEIAAWELGSGRRKGFYLSNLYPLVGFLLGLVVIPKRTRRAYRKGKQRINAHILSHRVSVLETELEELQRLSQRNEDEPARG